MKYKKNPTIAIIGLGYTGLPLAINFSKFFNVVGFDNDSYKINNLNKFKDKTGETNINEIKTFLSKNIFTSDLNKIKNVDIYIVAVPTPIDRNNKPDLNILKTASKIVAESIKKGSIVIFESTVYPGCTEDVCIKILEKYSGFELNKDFFCGYSPERINPGDKNKKLKDIVKITSGSNRASADYIDKIYKKIIDAGTFKVSSIKVAEASKVIENIQRDLNIALVNELSTIFRKLKLDTNEIINAASTKWNFSKFTPGLVGGHCISVDPYYLTYIAKKNKINPKVILAGRKINDYMPSYIVKEIKKKIKGKDKKKCLILGLSFKENCPDIRNSKVFDIINEFKKTNIKVSAFDPIVDHLEVENKFNFIPLKKIEKSMKFDFIILAVKHTIFKKMEKSIKQKLKKDGFIFDIKSFFKKTNYIDRL